MTRTATILAVLAAATLLDHVVGLNEMTPPAWELSPVPGSDPTRYAPVQLYRDGVAWPVPIPAAPADDDPMCVMWPEWCEQRRAERDAAFALNATGLAEIRGARTSGDPDFNGSGVVDSQDFFDFMAAWGPVANGGTP